MEKFFYFTLSMLLASSINAGTLMTTFTDDEGNPIKDAVIEILSPQQPIPEDWDYSAIMDQVDKEFVNNVVIVVKGSQVYFPNSDDIQHHVYSFSDNKAFELPLYSGNEANPVLFEEPGVTVVGCNIHDWMLGYIYVGESHLMATSNTEGKALITDLPAGDYKFRIWHERARRRDQFGEYEATLPDQGSVSVDIVLDLGRDRRIRRAPTGSDSNYN